MNYRLNLIPVQALFRRITCGRNYDTIERNTWRVKTTEYLPDLTESDWTDNDRNLVYTNEMGQVLMKVFQDYEGTTLVSSQRTAFRYDAAGRLILTMQPSAVTGHTETLADLIGYNSGNGRATNVSQTNGIVHLFDWYDGTGGSGDDNATETTAGGVKGYLDTTSLSRGLDGNASNDVKQLKLTREQAAFVRPLAK